MPSSCESVFLNNSAKDYLLIPSVPTPNGRLHLGHVGGPYLSADILARYLRRNGHKVRVISGTDSYESYVTAQAAKEHKTPEAVCNYYHALIADDLSAMDIQLDYFINPLEAQWDLHYRAWHNKIFRNLIDKGATQTVDELVGWDSQNCRYQTGCWLSGKCPLCKTKTESYFCEACGIHYRPEEVLEQNNLMYKVSNIFLRVPQITELQTQGINKNIETLYKSYLEQQNQLFRLTANSDWGIEYNQTSTLFSYGFVFAYFLMMGELAGTLNNDHKNAFASDSSVITIASFGHDNALPFLSSTLGITGACPEYKPFDYYLVNYFYNLDNKKFSTSRRHAIWVDELINKQKYSSDIVRLYLASIDIRNQTGNFNSAEFNQFYAKTCHWINYFIVQGLVGIQASGTECRGGLRENLTQFLIRQDQQLQLNQFMPHKDLGSVDDWLELGEELRDNSDDYFWWLHAFSLFLSPYMPRVSQSLWNALGYENQPALSAYLSHPVSSKNAFRGEESYHAIY